MSTNNIHTQSPVVAAQKPLAKAISVLNHRKVEILSGVSAAGLAGGTIALGILGGPIGAIVALAVAALAAFVLLIHSLASKPKVTSVETQPAPQEKMPANADSLFISMKDRLNNTDTFSLPNLEDLTQMMHLVADTNTSVPALQAGETTPSAEPAIEEPQKAPMPAEKEVRFKKLRNAFANGVSYAKAHPYKTAIGVTAGLAAVAGLGYGAVAAYGALTAPAVAQGMAPASAGILMPAPKPSVCVNPNLQTGQLLIAPPPAMPQPIIPTANINTTLNSATLKAKLPKLMGAQIMALPPKGPDFVISSIVINRPETIGKGLVVRPTTPAQTSKFKFAIDAMRKALPVYPMGKQVAIRHS